MQQRYGAEPALWSWGAAHYALSLHKPFGNVPLLARFFDVTAPTGGDSFSINVGQYWPNGTENRFVNRHAASMRAVYDLDNLEKSQFIYQTGQSGLVFSSRYRDMREAWVAVKYRAMQMNPAAFSHRLQLTP